MKKQPQSDFGVASETVLPSGRKIGIGTGRLFDLASSFEKRGQPEELAEVQRVDDVRRFVGVLYYREPQKGTASAPQARRASAPRRTALGPYPSGFTLATIEDEIRNWSHDDQDAFLAFLAGDEMQTLLRKAFRRVRDARFARKQRTGEPLTEFEKLLHSRVVLDNTQRFHEASKRGETEPTSLSRWFLHDTWTAREGFLLLMGLDPGGTVFEETVDILGQPLEEFRITCYLDGRGIDLTLWKLEYQKRQKESALAREQGRHRLALAIRTRRYDTDEIRKEISQLSDTYNTMMSIWNSGEHPKRNPPVYYIAWAEAQGFEVPWIDWAREKGFLPHPQQSGEGASTAEHTEVDEQPTSARPSEQRDKELQEAANSLAQELKRQGRRDITRRVVAKELACSDEYKEMTADRIERIIRRRW